MFIQQLLSSYGAAAAGRNTNPMSQISGVQALFDLDATLTSSYGGSGQTWANLIASPDDGSGQTAYDFFLGATNSATTDDPTFTGLANDVGAYFSFDGGDLFQIAAGNTTKLANLHKTTGGGPFTIVVAGRSEGTVGTNGICGNIAGGGGAGAGFRISSTQLTAVHSDGTTVRTSDATISLSANTIYLAAVAVDYTSTTFKTAFNARTFTSGTQNKGTVTATATTFQLASIGNGATKMRNTHRMYGIYAFNKLLSDADLSAVVDVLNSRHARTYA
jgi:hypothetical protein